MIDHLTLMVGPLTSIPGPWPRSDKWPRRIANPLLALAPPTTVSIQILFGLCLIRPVFDLMHLTGETVHLTLFKAAYATAYE